VSRGLPDADNGGAPGGTGMEPTVPVCELGTQRRTLEPELRAAFDRVLDRSWFVLGEEGRLFEEEFARFLGLDQVVGVGSGTEALHLALRALGVGPGDLVLTAGNSANATPSAILAAGAVPVFADVDPRTGLLDVAEAERRWRPGIRALLPVHLYGRCLGMEPILELARRRGVPVVEDAAQAHGASHRGRMAGTWGDIGCFSFYPSKNLGAYGDAGACATRDPALAQKLRGLRSYGESNRYQAEFPGINSRLDELQAAVLRVKLPHLARWNQRRREICAFYRERLRGLPLLLPPEEAEEVEAPHLFVVQAARRDRLRRELLHRGIGTQIHYPIPSHLQPAFAPFGQGPGSLPVCEGRAGRILSLPLYPELTAEQLARVAGALHDSLRGEPPPEEAAC